MGHGHDHHHATAARGGQRHRRPLEIALALTVAFLVVQVVVGFATGSLALISDAGHMATDSLGLAMALTAIVVASRGSSRSTHTFGTYRLEILAALANAVLLFGVAGYVLYEAAVRLGDPPEVASMPVLIVGVIGLGVNVAAFALLRAGAKESLNIEGAYVEVLSDALGSLGVIVAAVVMHVTGWRWVDAAIGSAIGLFILPRAWRLGAEALRVLLQVAPGHIDIDELRRDLAALDGVVDVHDLHLWTLTSEMEVLTAHLRTAPGADAHSVLDDARSMLAAKHGLDHATLQVEPLDHEGCDAVDW